MATDGTLFIQWQRKGIGKIIKRSGTQDAKVRDAMQSMLDTLYSHGKHDILEAIRDNKLTPMQVYSAHATGNLETVAAPENLMPLNEDTLCGWVDKHTELADTTKKGYRNRFKLFLKTVVEHSTLSDIPKYLKLYRESYVEKARSFNETRAALLSFISSSFSQFSKLYQNTYIVKPLKVKPTRQARHLTYTQVLELCDRMKKLDTKWNYAETDVRFGGGTKAAKMFLTMCLLGTNPKEYFSDGWELDKKNKCVRIHGQKREGRERLVPLFDAPYTQPLLNEKHLRKYLGAASNGHVVPKDARNTFVFWLTESGVVENHRKSYLGHGPKDITAHYEKKADSREALLKDAASVNAWLKPQAERWKGSGGIELWAESAGTSIL